jgi:hypothetical protein
MAEKPPLKRILKCVRRPKPNTFRFEDVAQPLHRPAKPAVHTRRIYQYERREL